MLEGKSFGIARRLTHKYLDPEYKMTHLFQTFILSMKIMSSYILINTVNVTDQMCQRAVYVAENVVK